MPEVCEVCLTAQYLNWIVGHEITQINVIGGRYLKKDIKGIDKLKFPLKITGIDTKGKFMWFTLMHNDKTFYMLNTFGLTGKWSFDKFDRTEISHVTKIQVNRFCSNLEFHTSKI